MQEEGYRSLERRERSIADFEDETVRRAYEAVTGAAVNGDASRVPTPIAFKLFGSEIQHQTDDVLDLSVGVARTWRAVDGAAALVELGVSLDDVEGILLSTFQELEYADVESAIKLLHDYQILS